MFFEKTMESETVYHGRVIDVERQKVLLINGNEAGREIVRHNGGACMAAIDQNLDFYLVRQFRKPLDTETLEIPAGKLEKGEDPYHCAVRELKEETGLIGGRIESLGHVFTTPGFCDEKLYIYLAQDLEQSSSDPDPDEFVSCEKYPLAKCVEMVESGLICDAKTVVAILRTARKFKVI
ncbi:MAG: NUDIX hydrolase [Saccharofermentanales bacterium]